MGVRTDSFRRPVTDEAVKQISIVIPVFNEEKYIGGLLESIARITYPKENYEVIVVSDGSTDSTAEIVRGFSQVRLIELPQNVGRYKCRETGARAAKFPYMLFIDAHSVIAPNVLTVLNKLDKPVVAGYVVGEKTPGPFETFYQAIRRVVFRQFFNQYNTPYYLTAQNFDTLPKGTGVFFIEKKILFRAYCDLTAFDMGRDSSDDTKLLRTVANLVPILVHPAVKITYFSRTSFAASVNHLWGRGAKFVDYYLDPDKRFFWLVIALPLILLVAVLLGLMFLPLSLGLKIAALIGLDVLISLFLAKTVREFFVILLMAPLCGCVFYLGVLRGLILKACKATKSQGSDPIEPAGDASNQ